MSSVVFLILAIIIIGILVFIAISITGNKNYEFDKEEYQTDFLAIENSLSKDNELSFNACGQNVKMDLFYNSLHDQRE